MHPRRSFDEIRVAGSILRWIVPVAVILLAVASSGDSVGSGTETATGVQVTKRVPFARESIEEIRALAPFRSQPVPRIRNIPYLRISRQSRTTGEAGSQPAAPVLAAPSFASSPVALAPALDESFAGLGNPPHNQDVIPPDTMGAVGPNHVVSLLNSDFGVFNKSTGALISNQRIPLQSFWGILGVDPGDPANFPFDPKILYDQHSGRFIAITLGGRSAPDSWIMIAVSSTPDPTGAWDKWAIDADMDVDVQTVNAADFPGLGVDATNVYITANMFNGTSAQYSKVWIIPKAQLLTAEPPATITWFEISDPPGSDFTMQPAHTFGSPGAEYFLSEGSPDHIAVSSMDNLSGTPVWHSPLQVQVTHYISTGSLPGAPQSGTIDTIATSDTRLLNTVYRNGSVWTTHNLAVNGKVEVAWYRINPLTGMVESQGRVNDPSRWYYYPSIAVNKDNVAAIGFTGSSATEYAGGYYTLVQPSSGSAEPVALLKAGEATYSKFFDGNENRWGDFSATVVDPTDDTTFWTVQEYAMTHDTITDSNNNTVDRSRWGTWWGKFHPTDVLSPALLTATADITPQVILNWTDRATNETGYVVERKVGAAGAFVVLTSLPLPPNSATYTDNAGLVAGVTYYYRVGAAGASGTSYSLEASVTIPGAATPSGGGGGGGCLTIIRSKDDASFGASLFAFGILLLPAGALGLRRVFRAREETAPSRHPAC